MKIIQVNGWSGRLNGPLARLIKSESPDFVCVQEAFRIGTEAVPQFDDQYGYTTELKAAGDFKYDHFAPAWGFILAGQKIDSGNLILSKFPLNKHKGDHINSSYYVHDGDSQPKSTPRVLQTCLAKLDNGKILALANYQGYLKPRDAKGNQKTVESLEKVTSQLRKLPKPLIFCADLNISPASPALKVLDGIRLRNLTVEHKVKTTLSEVHRAPIEDRRSVACDYIFCSYDVQAQNFRVAEQIVSDHKALILEFEL